MDENVRTFNSGSDDYARARPRYPEGLYPFLAGLAPSRRRAWDCACGTGQVALSLVHQFQDVYATDINDKQIAAVENNARIHCSVAGAEDSGFADDYFDLVCVAQALHWFDLDRFYAEAARVLRQDGILACWGYGEFEVDPAVDAVIEETVLAPIKPHWSPRNGQLWNHYADIVLPFPPVSVPEFSMSFSWTKAQVLGYMSTWSAYKRHREQTSADVMRDCAKGLERLWPDGEVRTVNFDFFVKAARSM